MIVKSKGNAVFDYSKFVMSILIVTLHTRFLLTVLHPFQRVAVPLFFILSSYFFFCKVKTMQDTAQQKTALWSFCKRNLQLYAFWTIALLPIVLYMHRGWFSQGILRGILVMVRDLIFAGSFTASWFITALVMATALIFWVSKKLSNTWLLSLGFVIYVAVLFFSAYAFVIKEGSALAVGMQWYMDIFTLPYNSFPVALLWVAMGKCFADGTFDGLEKVFAKINRWICLVVVMALVYAEWMFVWYISGGVSKDCYITLVVAVPVIFQIIKGISLEANAKSQFLRQASIIIYALHSSVLHVLRPILRMIGLEYNGLLFVLISLGCLAATWIILRLEKTKAFRWLKYAH